MLDAVCLQCIYLWNCSINCYLTLEILIQNLTGLSHDHDGKKMYRQVNVQATQEMCKKLAIMISTCYNYA